MNRLFRPAIVLPVAFVLTLIGTLLHPKPPQGGELHAVGVMSTSAAWIPAHVLILAGRVLLLAGTIFIVREHLLSPRSLLVGKIVLVGAAIGLVEMVFHLFAFEESNALISGAPAPLADVHVITQIVSYPVIGLGLAALAILESGRFGAGFSVLSVIAALGSLIFGVSPAIVLPTNNASLGILMSADVFPLLWLAVFAVIASRRTARATFA